jgi:non-ribosomal peptide synthetase component F
LDSELRPVKDGESGEIYIGGSGVTMGYLNRPDLTKERFILNPILQDREMVPRLYRTGDLGRTTPAGEIEYLGRVNTQVKSRGYRIELGEIEQMLCVDPAIGSSAISQSQAQPSKLKLLQSNKFKKYL